MLETICDAIGIVSGSYLAWRAFVGAATETAAGALAARWVIHVAGIDLAWRGSAGTTRYATRSALQLARCLGARSVALPLIGAGSGGLSPSSAQQIMRAELEAQAPCFDRLELVVLGRRRGAGRS